MTAAALHAPTPRPRDVVRAQIRAVGSAFRRPAILVATLGTLTAVLVTTAFVGTGSAIEFHPYRYELFGVLGVLLPIRIWMGAERLGNGLLWTLPVDRRWHALAKVFAGWIWLIGVVALFVFALLALTLLSGGSVIADESLRLVSSEAFRSGTTIDASVVRTVRWTPHPLYWLVPFTAATGTYLLASALALGTRHPALWIAGTLLALFVVQGVSEDVNAEWLATPPGRMLLGLFDGPYGFDALLTARTGSSKTEATLPGGETVVVWKALPDLRQWATATLLWSGAGLAGLWAAASRHRERRRS